MERHKDCDLQAHAKACVSDMGLTQWNRGREPDASSETDEHAAIATRAVFNALLTLQREVDRRALCPNLLREEYSSVVSDLGENAGDEAKLVAALITKSDWTPKGAKAIHGLATTYGTSILRNALALAEALAIEDGSAGL